MFGHAACSWSTRRTVTVEILWALADVAPYSREYHSARQRVAQQARGDIELEIEYEKIMNLVKKTRESIIRMNDRHFTALLMRAPKGGRTINCL